MTELTVPSSSDGNLSDDDVCIIKEDCVRVQKLEATEKTGTGNRCYKCKSHFCDSELRVCIYCVNQKKQLVVVDTGNYLILDEDQILKRLLCGNCKKDTRCKTLTNPTGYHLTIKFEVLRLLTDFNFELYLYMSRHNKLEFPSRQPALQKFREDYVFAKTEEEKISVLKKVEDFVRDSVPVKIEPREVIEVITIDDED